MIRRLGNGFIPHLRAYATYRRSNTYVKNGLVEKQDHTDDFRLLRPNTNDHIHQLDPKQVRRLENKVKADAQKLSTSISLLKSYLKQREALVDHILLVESVDGFLENLLHRNDESILPELGQVLTDIADPQYDSEIANSITLLSALFINTFLVELNAAYALSGKTPANIELDSFLLRPQLFNCIKDEPKRLEIMKILALMYLGDEKNPSFLLFISQLDEPTISSICSSMPSSDDFFSLEHYRYHFLHYKSSQSLNYDHSDTIRAIQSISRPRFTTPNTDSSRYMIGFSNAFDTYYNSSESYAGRMNLVLSITKVLLSTAGPAPNHSIFRYLIDELGNANLLNYQSLVFNSIPGYEHKKTMLGSSTESIIAPRAALHYKRAIEDDPDILGSLMLYLSRRASNNSFEQFLSFYRLNEVVKHERVLDNSNFSSLVSKSRFTRNRDIDLHSVVFDTDMPIIASVDLVYNAIACCIELGQFQYIDPLFNKMIVHTVDLGGEVHVALSLGNQKDLTNSEFSLLLAQNLTFAEMADKLFTKKLLILLLKASRLSDDVGRMMWLTPHLDAYLTKHFESSSQHIDEIKKFASEDSVSEAYAAEFWEQDSQALIDTSLITEIELALTALSLDGKKLAYSKFLDFSRTAGLTPKSKKRES